MPIVFIHGVATRSGPDFDKGKEQRETFFRETVARTTLKNTNALILQPMWGDLVPAFPNNNPIIPPVNPTGVQPFGPELFQPDSPDMVGVAIGSEKPPMEKRLLSVAKRSFPEAIDLLWHETSLGPDVHGDADREATLLAAGTAASVYAQENPSPDWVHGVADDNAFLEELIKELEKWGQSGAPKPPSVQPFGALDDLLGWLKGAAQTVQQKLVDIPTDALLRAFRPGLTKGLVLFFGDILFYQNTRGAEGSPGQIIQTILKSLQEARAQADAKGEKLVVVGHSMGGNILYDIFTYYAKALVVDAFITVGCQASLLKQMKVFRIQENGAFGSGQKAPKPDNVKSWFNIFDPQDILSFAFEPEFNGVTDYVFETLGGVLGAHGGYFERVRFYERMVARLA